MEHHAEKTPAISALDRYNQAFEQWRFASEVRFKILAAWWAVYIGLAAVLKWAWEYESLRRFAYVVPLVAALATALFWLMDELNGGAIYAGKEIVEEIEKTAGIDEAKRMVRLTTTQTWVPSHSKLIRIFAAVGFSASAIAAGYLLCPGR